MSALSSWAQGIDLSRIIEWLMYAVAALIAISVHESCHGLSAYWLGDDTAKRMGRISINPLRHLDVVGFLMMVVAHFGWAKPVPVNPYRMTKVKSPKVGMALTAAAGPLSNVALALIFSFLAALSSILYYEDLVARLAAGTLTDQRTSLFYLYEFFFVCMALNAALAVFNLIPVSPLDGSKILAIVLPEKAYAQLMRYERYGFIVLAVLLFTGILDGPIIALREGLLRLLTAGTVPLARLLTGTEMPAGLLLEMMGL